MFQGSGGEGTSPPDRSYDTFQLPAQACRFRQSLGKTSCPRT